MIVVGENIAAAADKSKSEDELPEEDNKWIMVHVTEGETLESFKMSSMHLDRFIIATKINI